MNTIKMYEALRSFLGDENAKVVVDEIANIRELDYAKLKEVFATKEDLHTSINSLERRLSDKIDKIYWFILGQTAILVGLILAILRLVDLV